jgi:DNA-binding LacI/PurR family transcriptional regulator
VVLIAQGDQNQRLLLADPRSRTIVESFEHESKQFGYNGITEQFNPQYASAFMDITRRIKAHSNCVGFVLNIWNPWDEVVWQRWLDLIDSLVARDVPVFVIDHAANLIVPDSLAQQKNLKILRIAGLRSGEMVGEFLFRQGHRSVAFISPYLNLDWAQHRLSGLRQFFMRYAPAGANVEIHGHHELENQHDLVVALLNRDAHSIGNIYRGRLTGAQTGALLASLDEERRISLAARLAIDPIAHTLQPIAQSLASVAETPYDVETFTGIQDKILATMSTDALKLYLRPLFAQVLDKSKATAWICSDEVTAYSALSFLRRGKKRVPEEIALVGFENNPDSVSYQLTTYDFNMRGIVQKALLAMTDKKVMSKMSRVSEVEGFVVERRTTRR